MPHHLEAFALKATGSSKTLAAPVMSVGLAETTVARSRHVGLTGPNPEQRTTWIHVANEGEWEGHPNGPFALDRGTFKQCIAALRQTATPPPVDYDHASLRPLDGQPTPAAGYVLDLEMRRDGLYALVEFTPSAAQMIRGGEYRFCSGVFVWDAADRKTGEPIPCQLDSIGLTNKPFIDGQHAIRLSRRALSTGETMEISKKDLMAKLDALVAGPAVTGEQLDALVEFLKKSAGPEVEAAEEAAEEKAEAKSESMPPPAGEVEESEVVDMACGPKGEREMDKKALAAPPPPAMAMAEPMVPAEPVPALAPETAAAATQDAAAMLLTKLAEMTGLDTASIIGSLDANAESIKAAFLGANGGALPATVLSAKLEAQDATITALSAEVARYRADEAKRADAALVAEVEAHVAAGRILPGSRETWVSLARKAPTEFRALAAKLPSAVPMGREAPVEAPATAPNGGAGDPDKSHPRFAVLHRQYSDPSSPYARLLPHSGPEREAAIERAVINHLRREQPISG